MSGFFFGANCHGQGLKNTQRYLDYHQRTKPNFTLGLDCVGLLRQVKAVSPTTNVIVRQFKDDGYWYTKSPAEFLKFMDGECKDLDCWYLVENEAGFTDKIPGRDITPIQWNIDLIKLNASRPKPAKLVILNLSVGTPEPNDWDAAKELLKLCDQHREHVIAGLHEYAAAVITSGFTGSHPADTRFHDDFTKTANWPELATARTMTKWFCGRFEFLVAACKRMGINPPRVVLTEHGFDDVSVIGAWLQSLPLTPPYKQIKGFKTLREWWKQVWPSWSQDEAYVENLKYGAENIYAGTVVEGACVWCVGHVDERWEGDDAEGHEEFFWRLEQYAAQKENEVSVATKPIPMPKPDNAGLGTKVKTKFAAPYRNLRAGAGTIFADCGDVHTGDQLTIFYNTLRSDSNGLKWAWVEDTPSGAGWINTDGITFTNVATSEVPKVDPPSPPVVTLPIPPAPGIDDPEVTPVTPRTFTYTMQIQVKAETEIAAEKVAEYALASVRYDWQRFLEIAKLSSSLSQIKDASFVIELPGKA